MLYRRAQITRTPSNQSSSTPRVKACELAHTSLGQTSTRLTAKTLAANAPPSRSRAERDEISISNCLDESTPLRGTQSSKSAQVSGVTSLPYRRGATSVPRHRKASDKKAL